MGLEQGVGRGDGNHKYSRTEEGTLVILLTGIPEEFDLKNLKSYSGQKKIPDKWRSG